MALGSKTIYVDLDDVLCQTARHFLVVVEREFGKRVSYEQLTDFDIGTSCALHTEEREHLYRVVHEPDELMKMAPIEAAIAALRQWVEAGFEIAIVTGRPPDSYEPSLAWLSRHSVTNHSFTMVNKYARFETENTVAISLDELATRNYCWAVEDSLPMAQYLAGQMNVRVALIDCPWNQASPNHPSVDRFTDWPTVAQAMPKFAAR
ncbi:MAG: hypothetical protein HW419_2422 [Deltaproteobacteria bacterium]|nr:hypothetical protein [Deltaproteobacteria bacterium]